MRWSGLSNRTCCTGLCLRGTDLWSTHSPDLFHVTFTCGAYTVVYETDPHTLDNLKANVHSVIEANDYNIKHQASLKKITRP